MSSEWIASVLQTARDVHPMHGKVTSHHMHHDNHLVVQVTIPPLEDLVLPSSPPQPFCFQLIVPPGFPTSSGVPSVCLPDDVVQVQQVESLLQSQGTGTTTASLVEGSRSSHGLPQLIFPWLDTGTPLEASYGLGVWIYTVRNLFISPDYKPWYTPPTFLQQFKTKDVDRRPVVLLCGAGAAKGKRPYMEDVNFSFPSVRISGNSYCSVFGVLDGHGGVECSRFAVEELPTQIVSSMRSGLSSCQSLFNSFKNTDEEFICSMNSKSGSTATVLLWNQSTGIANLANAGDSRAVLSRGNKAVDVARDMKATDSCEIARIAKAGGYVSRGRVNGSLAIARAIGDKPLKMGSSPPLIAEPEIVTFKFQTEDQFLIIASDGLWDVMTSQAAVDMAASMICDNDVLAEIFTGNNPFKDCASDVEIYQRELSKIGDFMANHACNVLNSLDNITVMIIMIKRHRTEVQERDGFLYPETRMCPENHQRCDQKERSTTLTASCATAQASVFSADRSRGGEERELEDIRHMSSMTVEASFSKTESMDDDDVMSFLLDDSNF